VKSSVAHDRSLAELRAEAHQQILRTEEYLSTVSDRIESLLNDAEQQRLDLQQFIDSFALEADMLGTPKHEAQEDSTFNIEEIQRERGELAHYVAQSRTLRSTVEAVAQLVRTGRELLSDERAIRAVSGSEDVRLQQAMNAAREEERGRLAREIHDGPAQVLANAIFIVGIAEQVLKRDPEKVPEQLSDVRALLKDGVAEIRRFMFDLRPSMLEDQGLGPTIRYYIDEFSRLFGKRVSLTMDEPLPVLSPDQELCLFRIVQESLQNVQKHADADEASVELRVTGRWLTLEIADSGRGFNPAMTLPRIGTGAGLPGMRERAKLIGADLTLESSPGKGTRLRLSIPLRMATDLLMPIESEMTE
jgi:two-component system, NarL family, sensor histidine kinase DegS